MKIAAKCALLAVLGGGFAVSTSLAQDLGSAAVAVGASAQGTAAAIAAVPSMPSAQDSAAAVAPHDAVAVEPAPAKADVGSDKDGDDAEKSDVDGVKVPVKVKSAIKRLDLSTEKATVDDLNAGREAIAKLDMLIDIEKRISDLSDIRQKRQESAGIQPLPATALAPQPMPMPTPVAAPVIAPPPMPMALPDADVNVVRIQGVPGRYVATIKEGGVDKPKDVRVGDKLSDASEVRSIDVRGVTLFKDNRTRVVVIKDAGYLVTGQSGS